MQSHGGRLRGLGRGSSGPGSHGRPGHAGDDLDGRRVAQNGNRGLHYGWGRIAAGDWVPAERGQHRRHLAASHGKSSWPATSTYRRPQCGPARWSGSASPTGRRAEVFPGLDLPPAGADGRARRGSALRGGCSTAARTTRSWMTTTEDRPAGAPSPPPRPSSPSTPLTGEVVAMLARALGRRGRGAAARPPRGRAAGGPALSYAERGEQLAAWRRPCSPVGCPSWPHVVHRETGKPHGDATRGDGGLAIDHLAWAAKHAEQGARPPQASPPGLVMANQAATVEYLPLGVVGVIGPWNYPVFTPMGSIAYALAAGNAVVFKPSELHPGRGQWLADDLRRGRRPSTPVFQVVTGLGETGAALCRAGVDKLAFTGSTATGKKVMAACAETLTPVLIEAGGKDALLVDADADLDAAADAALWGACANAGPDLHRRRAGLRPRAGLRRVPGPAGREGQGRHGPTTSPDAKIGPITMPSQLDVIRRTSTTPSPAAGGPCSAGATRSASGSCSRRCWSTCPRTPRRCRRRPSGRP